MSPVAPVTFTNCPNFSPCLTTLPTTGPLSYVGACIDTTEQARYTEFFDRNCGSGSTQLVNWSGTVQGTTQFGTSTVTRNVRASLSFDAFISGSNCGSVSGCAAVQQAVTSGFGFTGTCNSSGTQCTCELTRTIVKQSTDTMVVSQTSIELPSEGRVFDTCGTSGAIRYRERTPSDPLKVPEIGIYTLAPYP